DRLDELRDNLGYVADNTQVGDREDRGLAVLVDGDDVLGSLHAHHVLSRARDAASDVDSRLHRFAGLANLERVRDPAGVDDGARCARSAVQQLRQLDYERVVLGRAEPATPRHDDSRLVQLRTAARLFVPGDDPGRITCAGV